MKNSNTAQNVGVYFLIGLVICGALFMSQSEIPGGGGGAVSLTSTQVGYGSAANGVTSEAAFAYNATTNRLSVDGITLAAGSAAAPSLTGATANTGLHFATACVTISVGGNERTIWCSNEVYPGSDNAVDLGRTDRRWRNFYTYGVNIGTSGTTIASSFSGTGVLDFADRAGVYGCEELTVTCTGAATANTPDCIVGSSAAPTDGALTCRVSAANTCAVRYCGTGNPASMTVRTTSVGY